MQPPARDRVAVFVGVGLAIAGASVFARGLPALEWLNAGPATPQAGATLVAGLILLGLGVGLAATARFGQAGTYAGLATPALALGAGAMWAWLRAPELVQTAAVASPSTTTGGSSLLLATAVLASMVGLALLFVFGTRAKRSIR